VAWSHNDYTATLSTNLAGFPPVLFSGTGSVSRVGWTVGTGIEWAIWNNWSIKAEYDYIDFGTKAASINGSFAGGFGAALDLESTQHVNQFKFGVNWHIMPNIW
jgi:outer membrane immunogenic protein